MKLTDAIKSRKHIFTNWRYASGERFFESFDKTFGLQPITEFAYLLRYV